MKVKTNPWLLALAAIVIAGLFALVALGRITWPEFAVGVGLFGLPSVFGKSAPTPAILIALALSSLPACAAAPVAAESAYTAALLRCVDRAATLAESKSCRASVDAEYGVKK